MHGQMLVAFANRPALVFENLLENGSAAARLGYLALVESVITSA